jgi:hypothetical protein
MWTSLIAKDAWIKATVVQFGAKLGIYTTAGASLCEWEWRSRSSCLVIQQRFSSIIDMTCRAVADHQTSCGLLSPSSRCPCCHTSWRAARSAATKRVRAIPLPHPFTLHSPGLYCSSHGSYTVLNQSWRLAVFAYNSLFLLTGIVLSLSIPSGRPSVSACTSDRSDQNGLCTGLITRSQV